MCYLFFSLIFLSIGVFLVLWFEMFIGKRILCLIKWESKSRDIVFGVMVKKVGSFFYIFLDV